MRSSVLFWNCQISQRATVPGWYFLVFFTLPAWRNSFSGGFASHSRLELPPDWLLPTQSRWPSLHSHLGQLLGLWWQGQPSHILQPSCFLHPPLCLFHLLLSHGWGLSAWGWVMYWGGWPPSLLHQSSPHLSGTENPPLPAPLILLWSHFHPSHSIKQIGRCQPIEKQHDFILIRFCLVAILNL